MEQVEAVVTDRQGMIRALDQKAMLLVAIVAIFLQADANPIAIDCIQNELLAVSGWSGCASLLFGLAVVWPRGVSKLAKRDKITGEDVANLNRIVAVKSVILKLSIGAASLMVVAWGV